MAVHGATRDAQFDRLTVHRIDVIEPTARRGFHFGPERIPGGALSWARHSQKVPQRLRRHVVRQRRGYRGRRADLRWIRRKWQSLKLQPLEFRSIRPGSDHRHWHISEWWAATSGHSVE